MMCFNLSRLSLMSWPLSNLLLRLINTTGVVRSPFPSASAAAAAAHRERSGFTMGKRKNKKNRSSSLTTTTLKKRSSSSKKEEKEKEKETETETEKDVVNSSRLCEWTQILARVPAEDLLEFKLVCKFWCDLIESSVFIDLHTTFNFFSSSSSRFGSFVFLVNEYYPSLIMLSSTESESADDGQDRRQVDNLGGESEDVFKVEVDNNNNNLGGGGGGAGSSNDDQQQQQLLVLKLKSLGFPDYDESSSCYESFKEIVGSCNGLVCLYDRISNRFCLCNPAIEESRILPQPIEIGRDWPDRLAAFGFDVETKDYKVVLITGYMLMYYRTVAPMECICRVQVYSLSTDSWRLVEGITCLPGDSCRYPSEVLYLNGSCFFLAKFFHTKQQPCFPESDRFIISFDFAKEIITPIQLPDHHRYQELYLTSLGDKIALFTRKKHYQNGTCGYEGYNILVLKEHGGSSSNNSSVNKDSWTKLHSFRIETTRPGEWNLPCGISNDGEFALLETRGSTRFGGNKMKLYNLVTKEVKRNFLSCTLVMSKAIAYKPSLVSIMRGKQQHQPQKIG